MARQLAEVLFEFKQIGRSVKVTAIDPVSGIEASIVGPAGGSEMELKRVAVAKLRYVMERRQSPKR
ncbi:MAG TPA: hypothetical protein VEU47_02730 [Candidatus Cybelea sp.]|nr:hypothetical protein [Candidatus Cybelea sp.]